MPCNFSKAVWAELVLRCVELYGIGSIEKKLYYLDKLLQYIS